MTSPTLLIGLALLAGYAVGRCRPWARFSQWADWQAHHGRWWVATRPRRAAVYLGMALTAPVYTVQARLYTVRARRCRDDPPPPRSPAIQVRDLTADETR